MIKATEVLPVIGERVEVDSGIFPTFYRYGATCWYNQMGESDEPVYNDDLVASLEQAYQNFKNEMSIPIENEDAEDLYWRLHSLSKALEGSGRIDEDDYPDAYATVLDAMNFVRERTK